MIIGEIRRYLRDNNSIRVSRSVRDLAYRAMQTREQLSANMDKDPTVEQIAAAMGEKTEEVGRALEAIADPVSLYETVYSDGGDSIFLMDQLADESCTDEMWLEEIALQEAISHLDERERKIIHMRFYGGRTQMEIAREIGISQAQVSRLEKGAFDRIRKEM